MGCERQTDLRVEAPAGDRSVAPGRRRGAPSVLRHAAESAVRARHWDGVSGHGGGLRDMGHPRRARLECGAVVSCVDRRQPCRGPGRSGPPDPGLVGRHDRSRQGDRHRPVLRGVRERARRMSRFDRPRLPASSRRPPVWEPVSGRDRTRHGACAGPSGDASRHRRVAQRGRRFDGRDASARVGGDVPAAGSFDRPDRHMCAGDGTADRVGGNRSPRDPARPALAWWRLLRRSTR